MYKSKTNNKMTLQTLSTQKISSKNFQSHFAVYKNIDDICISNNETYTAHMVHISIFECFFNVYR